MLKKLILPLCLAFIAIFAFSPLAQARVDILPRIVVIEPRDRNGEVTVLNLFGKPGLYRVRVIHFEQDENGKYTKLNEPLSPDFDPERLVRISPKQFEVDTAGRQKVRIAARRSSVLPDGEYRFHIVATRYDTFEQAEAAQEQDVRVQVNMNLGVSIPVIVRHGNVSVDATFQNIAYIPPQSVETVGAAAEITTVVSRTGNASALGTLRAFLIDDNGREEPIGSMANFNVFTEIDQRNVRLPLKVDPKGKGKVRIVFEGLDGRVYDEQIITP